MTIHKEGYATLTLLALVLGALNFSIAHFELLPAVFIQVLGIVSIGFYLFILQFFRNPQRVISAEDHQVLAPADGKVVVIEKTTETEYFKDERIQVSIFMSPLNVHVCRSPLAGAVKFFKYHAGKYLVAWHPKSSTDNERTTMVVQTASGQEILVRQIAGAVARRIKWYVDENSTLAQGQEYGFIKFGSRLDIFLPLDADIKTQIDDKPRGGQTVIAELR